MISFEDAKEKALKRIGETDSVKILSATEKQKFQVPGNIEAWIVESEVSNNGLGQSIEFLIVFRDEGFPLVLPKIFLSPNSYNQFKNLPHVQSDHIVCAFSDAAQPDPSRPDDVIAELIKQAKRIIEDGISKKNYKDFEDEFVAYWDRTYEKNEKSLGAALLVTQTDLHETFNVILLTRPIGLIDVIIHQGEDDAKRFLDVLTRFKNEFNELTGFYVGELPGLEYPPFALTNRDTFALIKKFDEGKYSSLISFLNKKKSYKCVLFSKTINRKKVYFGWLYKSPIVFRNGFRPGTISSFQALSTFQSNDLVSRFNTEELTPARLAKRSGGTAESTQPKIFTIAGIGSIGSNLIPFLNSLNEPEFRLIDPEILAIENIGRHLLGFSEVSRFKTKAIQDYIQLKKPTQAVSTREESIITTVKNDLTYLNSSDFIFVALGKMTIEKWLASLVKAKTIQVPICFLWVEPYLAGGHCILLDPDEHKFDEYFNSNGLFSFNAIHEDEYLSNNPLLSLKEAGCQTDYIPYSATNVVVFLGALFPYLLQSIRTGLSGSSSISWIGDLKAVQNLGIKISEMGLKHNYGSIIKH